MRIRNGMRWFSAIMVFALLLSVSAPAFAVSKIGVSPTEVLDHLDNEFEYLSDELVEYLIDIYGEDFDLEGGDPGDEEEEPAEPTPESAALESLYDWITILSSVYGDASEYLSAFVEVEDVRSTSETDKETGDVYYTKASRNSFVYGSNFKDGGAVAEVKGVYNRADGRFTVDTKSDLYFKDKSMHMVDAFDFVDANGYIYMQVAYYDDYDEDYSAHMYDVLRVMIGHGKVRCSIGSMTEQELQFGRVKSAFTSWEAFCLKGDTDQFLFDGKTLQLIEGGKKTEIK